MKEITQEEHVDSYWEDRKRHESWTEKVNFEMFHKYYELEIEVYGNKLENHTVRIDGHDITTSLSDAEHSIAMGEIMANWPELEW